MSGKLVSGRKSTVSHTSAWAYKHVSFMRVRPWNDTVRQIIFINRRSTSRSNLIAPSETPTASYSTQVRSRSTKPAHVERTMISDTKTPQEEWATSREGFPSFRDFKEMRSKHYDDINAKRKKRGQEKTDEPVAPCIGSQDQFNFIWDALHTDKMGQLRHGTAEHCSKVKRNFALNGDGVVVAVACLRPVFIAAQTYHVLCLVHELAGHSGRIATLGKLKELYAPCVSEKLVQEFVTACLTCGTLNKGNVSSGSSSRGSPSVQGPTSSSTHSLRKHMNDKAASAVRRPGQCD
ncbi:hypothetical protein PLICRDRAFT_32325 [Plicaturopsis crispa FD-325 SS-3]|uniref:Integrase zinc-binding domain-containing protein n=1 Tax=Plicaturopsis crispa FD-325 SS-3 TaxID=944288 RepID=A0A0C9T8Y8_PLICR|nr:hypothetical protein PLICRDRAFT_32325 [Plicaturopsis crispa FD-325 SS-3]